MIPRGETTIHAEKSSQLHSFRLSANMNTEAASKAVTMITNGLGLLSCPQGTDVHNPAGIYIVSMTGYWDAYKLDIPMLSPMAMALAMMSSKRKPPSMPPSQDEADTEIGDFT
jgi:hypothetical protein